MCERFDCKFVEKSYFARNQVVFKSFADIYDLMRSLIKLNQRNPISKSYIGVKFRVSWKFTFFALSFTHDKIVWGKREKNNLRQNLFNFLCIISFCPYLQYYIYIQYCIKFLKKFFISNLSILMKKIILNL